MGIQATVVFTDLIGSTSAFESLGNVQATQAVTRVTAGLARLVAQKGGRVVKMLGDGVLALFNDPPSAIAAVIEMQRMHHGNMALIPAEHRMPIRIGVANGNVEIVAGDCYGDAVNVASRLSDMSGPDQIWANSAALEGSAETEHSRFRILGPISIRGRAEPCTVYQVEWQEDVSSDFLTIQGEIDSKFGRIGSDALGVQLELTWLGSQKRFKSFELPIQIGRVHQSDFAVNDPRVSRTHAKVEWRNGSVVLVDVSTYGSWVRFEGGGADLMLRREECVLHGRGEIALGTPFSDLSAPTISFSVA